MRPLERRYENLIFYLAHGYTVTDAAAHAGLSRSSVYKRWIRDPDFHRAVRAAQEDGDEIICKRCGEVAV